MSLQATKDRIDRMFQAQFGLPGGLSVLPARIGKGKLYEAKVLAVIASQLSTQEGLQLSLSSGTKLTLKSGGGPVNRRYPFVRVERAGSLVGEIWTDIWFLTLSYDVAGRPRLPEMGHYHELDIAMVEPGVNDGEMPTNDQIKIGVECKNTPFIKALLRGALGLRRELSFLNLSTPLPDTGFTTWPRPKVPAIPPSCLLVYSTSADILKYTAPEEVFGINFFHERL